MKINQKGLAITKVVLILFLIVAVGVLSWYVWQSKNNTSKTLDNTSQDAGSTTKTEDSNAPTNQPNDDPTSTWIAYTNPQGKYSLKYPDTWVMATSPEACSEGILLLGQNQQSVGKCATEDFGEVYLISIDGDRRSDYALNNLYIDVEKKDVSASGSRGQRQSGVAKGQLDGPDSPEVGGLPDGTKVVLYLFYANNKTYVIGYHQGSTYPSVLKEFDLIVTNTLRFE